MHHHTTHDLLATLAIRLKAVLIAFALGVISGPFIIKQLLVLLPVLITLCFTAIVLRAMVLRLWG